MFYKEVPADSVPQAARQAAADALAHGCRLLGFALPPEVRWCRPVVDPAEHARVLALPRPRNALAPPGYVFSLVPLCGLNDSTHWAMWLRANLGAKETAITALHELGHLRYRLNGCPHGDVGSPARAAEEAEVEAWAQAAYRQQAA